MGKFLRALLRRKIALAGALFLVLIFVLAIFADFVAPYDPMEINVDDRLQGPSAKHLFGTDNFGRDVASRVIHGARLTFVSGAGVVIFAVFFGIIVGTLAGYFRKFEFVSMRVIDVFMSFPDLLMALVLMAILGRGIVNIIIAVGATYLTRTARIIHGLTLKIKNEAYIEAIASEGASHLRILARHVVPNLISLIIVQATFTFAFSLLQIAALDFLGVGMPPQIPSWGNMLSECRLYILRAPWLLIFPGLFIVLTVLSFNLVGDVLRDQIDPRFRESIEGV
jgi:peptide/nickel transport system permease protein